MKTIVATIAFVCSGLLFAQHRNNDPWEAQAKQVLKLVGGCLGNQEAARLQSQFTSQEAADAFIKAYNSFRAKYPLLRVIKMSLRHDDRAFETDWLEVTYSVAKDDSLRAQFRQDFYFFRKGNEWKISRTSDFKGTRIYLAPAPASPPG